MSICIWLIPQVSDGKTKGVFQEMSTRICLLFIIAHLSLWCFFFFFFPPSFFQKLCVVHTIHITITIDSWGCSWLKYYWEDNYKLWVVVNVPDSALLKTSHTAQSCTLWACSHEWILHKEHLLPFP